MFGDVFSFTAADIAAITGPLHDSTYQWGLCVMPVVTGGGYTITSETTNQAGWGATLATFGTGAFAAGNSAWFYDISGSERAGTPSNPLYMIMDQPDSTLTSYTFDATGTSIGSAPPIIAPQPGGGGANVVTAAGNASVFTVGFSPDPAAT